MKGLNELALFAGGGGGILGGQLLGWRTRCAVEIDPYCRDILLARQRDGMLEPFLVWDDAKTFSGLPWRNHIDVVTGGFPCQDISAAGKGKGLAGSRSGLVFEMLRIVDEVRPRFVFAENSPNLRTRGLGTIIKEFTGMGYDVRWCVLGAWHVGAHQRRNRMWILATDITGKRPQTPLSKRVEKGGRNAPNSARWPCAPDLGGVVYGMADRMDCIKALGNGQVPRVAALAWRILHGDL